MRFREVMESVESNFKPHTCTLWFAKHTLHRKMKRLKVLLCDFLDSTTTVFYRVFVHMMIPQEGALTTTILNLSLQIIYLNEERDASR